MDWILLCPISEKREVERSGQPRPLFHTLTNYWQVIYR